MRSFKSSSDKGDKEFRAIPTLVSLVFTIGLSLTFTGVGVVAKPSSKDPFSPPSDTVLGIFKKAAVATDGVPCSEIGRDVLLDGGNAIDAAIAALFCIGVVHPQSSGIGGGFLMTIYNSSSKESICLNAREVAPLAAYKDMFEGNALLSQKGPLAVAVPGELAGFWAAHQKYGHLPWARLLAPSITLATEGVEVNKYLAEALNEQAVLIKLEPTMWDFLNRTTGEVLQEGDLLVRPVFASALRLIAQRGADVMYNGELGDKLVAEIQRRGGIITKEDLRSYRPEWVQPVKTAFSEFTMISFPPPGSGVLPAFIFNVLNNYDEIKKGNKKPVASDPLTYHQIAEAFKHAYAQRTKLGDPCCNETSIEEINQLVRNLTSVEFARQVFLKINDTATSNDPAYYGAVTYEPEHHGTSHVSVLDSEGLAVSVSSTINLRFGAGFTVGGIIMNDEMGDFSLPNVTNIFGVPPSPTNFIHPGKRPLSSMAPTILSQPGNGKVRMVIGAAGGTKIPSSVAYAIIRNIWFGETIKEAIDSRRMHHQLFPMEFQYEQDFPSDIVDNMTTKGHNVTSYTGGSVVTGISVEDGCIYANSDWRKSGNVAGIGDKC